MYLRELKEKDAAFMLEWMHDKTVVENMKQRFGEKTIDDCLRFIRQSNFLFNSDLHMAIVNNNDDYMGTVSLKNIDRINMCAEFAITMRSIAMGKGYSQYAMSTILHKGFSEMKLEKIYWYVSRENIRAVKFYEKQGYISKDIKPEFLGEKDEKDIDNEAMIWFVVYNNKNVE